jgi:hypothetical protein
VTAVADPGPDDVPIRSIEEKFEAVASGAGITLVPVTDTEPDESFAEG